MSPLLHSWSRSLRAGLLALLMLGVVVKPMLGSFCDIHALGDAVAGFVLDAGDLPAGPEHQGDRDHARGAHGQLHEDNNSGAYADLVAVIVVPAGPIGATALPPLTALAVPFQPVAAPFRPPIA